MIMMAWGLCWHSDSGDPNWGGRNSDGDALCFYPGVNVQGHRVVVDSDGRFPPDNKTKTYGAKDVSKVLRNTYPVVIKGGPSVLVFGEVRFLMHRCNREPFGSSQELRNPHLLSLP